MLKAEWRQKQMEFSRGIYHFIDINGYIFQAENQQRISEFEWHINQDGPVENTTFLKDLIYKPTRDGQKNITKFKIFELPNNPTFYRMG